MGLKGDLAIRELKIFFMKASLFGFFGKHL
jgi:hypothetical protein